MSTNFNLISPSDNGHEFNVRYNEPIVVAPNSSVMLNWAIFERTRDVVFTQDQSFSIIFDKVIPNKKMEDFTKSNEPTLSFTIPAGNYSLNDLQDKILTTMLGDNTKIFCGHNPTTRNIATFDKLGDLDNTQGVIRCNSYTYTTPQKLPIATSINFGFAFDGHRKLGRPNCRLELAMDVAGRSPHGANIEAGSVCIAGEAESSAKVFYASSNSANPDVKAFTNGSYTLTSAKYFHIGYDVDTYNQIDQHGNRVNVGGVDEFRDNNTVQWSFNKHLHDLNGSIFVGFYPEEMGGIVGGSNANYDQQCHNEGAGVYTEHATLRYATYNNDAGLNVPHPQSLGGLIFDDTSVKVIGLDFTAIDEAKAEKDLIAEFEYADIGINNTAQEDTTWGIQIYRPNLSVLNGEAVDINSTEKLFVRCFYYENGGAVRIWYDSNYTDADERWTYDFIFQNEFITPTNEAQTRAQLPFNVIMSATNSGEGIDEFFMNGINPQGNSGRVHHHPFVYHTDSIVEQYSLKCSNQLANLFRVTNTNDFTFEGKNPSTIGINTLKLLYNPFEAQHQNIFHQFYQFNHIIAQYKTDKYTIYLNELPIKVYQNTSDKSKSGNRRNILSNIPNPFGGAEDFDNGGGNVVGNYVPSLGVQNFLGNQLMTTNNFSISVRNMDDDTSATQIKRCIVNFSIMAPQQ